jgi:hypothetical protein
MTADRPHGPLPPLLVCLTVVTGFKLTLGYLEIPYGPLALWMPEVELANRSSLMRRPNAKQATATLKKVNQPIYIRSRKDTLRFLQGDPEAKPQRDGACSERLDS